MDGSAEVASIVYKRVTDTSGLSTSKHESKVSQVFQIRTAFYEVPTAAHSPLADGLWLLVIGFHH